MKKKTKQMISWCVPIFAAACGLVAFFMIFAEAVTYTGLILGDSFTGIQVALGYTVNDIQLFKASAGIIIGYLFPLLAACVAIIGKGKKILALLSAAMMLAGGVLVLCTLSLLDGGYVGTPALAAGSIVSGVFAIIGSVAECGSVLLKA